MSPGTEPPLAETHGLCANRKSCPGHTKKKGTGQQVYRGCCHLCERMKIYVLILHNCMHVYKLFQKKTTKKLAILVTPGRATKGGQGFGGEIPQHTRFLLRTHPQF